LHYASKHFINNNSKNMQYLDPVRNFIMIELASQVLATDLTINLKAGSGITLPNPSIDGAFNLTLWNATNYPNPINDNKKEIVRVTGLVGDVMTVSRGQEGTLAVDHNVPGCKYFVAMVITQKMIEDIDTALGNVIGAVPIRKELQAVTGAINSVNIVFGTSDTFKPLTLEIYLNGLRLIPDDFTVNGTNDGFTLSYPLDNGDVILVSYEVV
jgi:hypothetical protein